MHKRFASMLTDEELTDKVSYTFTRGPSQKELEFAASESPPEFLKWFKDGESGGTPYERGSALMSGLNACRAVVRAYRERKNAVSHLENYKRGIERAKESKEVA